MANPTVSVIVPNYNHVRFLRQRLESIYKQTYRDFELIILDDKSTDNSVEVIEAIVSENKNSGIPTRFIVNVTNTGSPFIQWKKGIEEARGKYIWIAESDDYADTAFIEKMMDVIERNNLDLCFCQSYRIDENNVNKGIYLGYPFYLEDRLFDFKSHGKEMCSFNMIPNASAAIFRRSSTPECWDKITCYRMSGDWAFWTYLMYKDGKCGYISTPYNYYRRHNTTTTSLKSHNFGNIEEAFDVILQFKKDGLPHNPYKWMNYWLNDAGYSFGVIFGTRFIPIISKVCRIKPSAAFVLLGKIFRQKFINTGIKFKKVLKHSNN